MSDVYKRLALKLGDLPSGYPATESGVELKILQKIFSPDEAELALQIKPIPETAEAIADRLGRPAAEMEKTLDEMVEKGQIATFKMFGQQMYMFFPFMVGIYEFQLDRLDKEIVALFEEYLPFLMKELGGHYPPVARVIPVSQNVDADLLVHPYEGIRRSIEKAKSFAVQECICRKEQALQGTSCKHTTEVCLSFSEEENAYAKKMPGRSVSKEEALAILDKAEEEGLVHCTYNVQQDEMFVCNCCSCCCALMRGVKQFKAPYLLAKSNFMASIDQDTCVQCGVCADERCPMDAIVEDGGEYTVLPERCIGCGVCVPTCTTESIRLVRRPEADQDTPPESLLHWNMQRGASRGVEFKLD